MDGHDAILGAGGYHSQHLLRTQVGGNESQASDPKWNAPVAVQKVIAGLYSSFDDETNGNDKHEIDENYQVVCEMQSHGNRYRG
jgi:hypothetical protein